MDEDIKSLGEAEAHLAKTRRRRRIMAALLFPVSVFALLVMAALLGAFDRWDEEALARGQWLVAEGADVSNEPPRVQTYWRTDPRVEAGLADFAERWVTTFDSLNPGAITQFDIDAYGNLYLMLDDRFDRLTVDQQRQLLDQLGTYYRTYLSGLVGELPVGTDFVPGVIVIDTLPGNPPVRAENRNGEVRIYRH